MSVSRKLKIIIQQLVDENADIRHSILDVSSSFEAVTSDLKSFPDYLQEEISQIKKEMEQIQPLYPSHRKTSVLFDREGMGQKGYLKAKELTKRIISVYRRLDKTE